MILEDTDKSALAYGHAFVVLAEPRLRAGIELGQVCLNYGYEVLEKYFFEPSGRPMPMSDLLIWDRSLHTGGRMRTCTLAGLLAAYHATSRAII